MCEFEKKWEEVGLSDDFMFGKVMQDSDLCRKLLERIFPNINIEHIEYPELQKTIKPDSDAHGIRLDVYVRDDKNSVYDIEMQAVDTKELPKRSRYYQSIIDIQELDAGRYYKELGQSFVIFICLQDVFGEGRHKYIFENRCCEDTNLVLQDGTQKIFLNASGTKDDVSEAMKKFLDYVAGKISDDPYVQELEAAIIKARNNQEWRHEFMTLQMRDRENIEKGIEQGKRKLIIEALQNGTSPEELISVLKIPAEEVYEIAKELEKQD